MNEERFAIVPYDKVSPEALESLIAEFIMREGTDYGKVEKSFSEKKNQLLKQMQSGEVLIAFDLAEETATLVTKDQFNKIKS